MTKQTQAKGLLENGHTSEEIGQLLGIHPGTIREWKRRYDWDSPKDTVWQVVETTPDGAIPEEYQRLMGRMSWKPCSALETYPYPGKWMES